MEITLYDDETFNKNDNNAQDSIRADLKDNKKKLAIGMTILSYGPI